MSNIFFKALCLLQWLFVGKISIVYGHVNQMCVDITSPTSMRIYFGSYHATTTGTVNIIGTSISLTADVLYSVSGDANGPSGSSAGLICGVNCVTSGETLVVDNTDMSYWMLVDITGLVYGDTYSISPNDDDGGGTNNNCDSTDSWAFTLETNSPTSNPTEPSMNPTVSPTDYPSILPSGAPSDSPTLSPTNFPSIIPTKMPTDIPTFSPTNFPSVIPTEMPTNKPTNVPSKEPSHSPTLTPTDIPTYNPTNAPTRNFTTINPNTVNNGASSSTTTNDSIFNTDSVLTVLLFVFIICLMCCLLCIFGCIIIYLFKKKKKQKEKAKKYGEMMHARSVSNTLDSNKMNGKSMDTLRSTSAPQGGFNTNSPLFNTSSNQYGSGDGEGGAGAGAGENTLQLAVLGASNSSKNINNSNNNNVSINDDVDDIENDDDVDITDLIDMRLDVQPQVNNMLLNVSGGAPVIGTAGGKELNEGLDDDEENEGRNINETTMIRPSIALINNPGGVNNNNNNNGGNKVGLEMDGDGNGNINLNKLDPGNNGKINNWNKWNASELMEYLRREMLSCNLDEEECNVFLSDLNEQRINGQMIAMIKQNKEFMDKLHQKLHKHPLAIWMVFQISIDNLE